LTPRVAAAHKKIWIEGLGAQPTSTGTLDMLRLPGVCIIITRRSLAPVRWVNNLEAFVKTLPAPA
jgi:hypothetical protein